jgi:hypothetical protein
MTEPSLDAKTLKRLITDEIFKAMGWPEHGLRHRVFSPLFSKATQRFAELFAMIDQQVALHGVVEAARWALPRFVTSFRAEGTENIPADGPLVIASNHPGTYDSLVIAASLPRPDLKIIGGDIPFLINLPHVSRHMIYTSYSDMLSRMTAVRQAIRHLQEGGSLLLFARAGIEPDPAVMPGAEDELSLWSQSLELFLKRVPATCVVVSIVSGVLSAKSLHHPLTWLRRKRVDRQRLAMFAQVIQQMVMGQNLSLTPWVTFGQVTSLERLNGLPGVLPVIIASAQQLLALRTT